MVTRQKIMADCAAIITTLNEVGTGSPETMLYLGIAADLEYWAVIRQVLLTANLVTIKANYVELTALGKQKADELEAALKAHNEAK